MRLPTLPFLLLLTACDGPGLFAAGAVNVASLTLTGRAVPDLVVSGVSGRDCSVARLDRGQSYCGASNAEPAPAPFCTRSLGSVDCWAVRPVAMPPQRGVGDAPVPVGGDMRRWPNLW